MGKKRYFCSHCNDFVSRGTRTRHLKEIAATNETSYDSDSSDFDGEFHDGSAFNPCFEDDRELASENFKHRRSEVRVVTGYHINWILYPTN